MLETQRNNYVKGDKKAELRDWFAWRGYTEYKPGCFTKDARYGNKNPEGFRRYKMAENVLRLELWMESTKSWLRIRSGYYSQIRIIEGKLAGMTR